MPAAQLLIDTDKSSKDENNITLSEFMMAHVIRKRNMKSKILFKSVKDFSKRNCFIDNTGLFNYLFILF